MYLIVFRLWDIKKRSKHHSRNLSPFFGQDISVILVVKKSYIMLGRIMALLFPLFGY